MNKTLKKRANKVYVNMSILYTGNWDIKNRRLPVELFLALLSAKTVLNHESNLFGQTRPDKA